jgi:hypothetical protein
MTAVARVRMSGPLTPYVEGFAVELTAHGYTDLSLANQLRLMADWSRWLQSAKTLVDQIDHDVVARFLAKRRRTHTQFITERALAPLLRYLHAIGAVSVMKQEQRPQGEVLGEYERYLIEERAVLPARRALCLAVAADFLAWSLSPILGFDSDSHRAGTRTGVREVARPEPPPRARPHRATRCIANHTARARARRRRSPPSCRRRAASCADTRCRC